MTEYEFEYWQEVTQNSKYRWMEDAITRLNGNGTLFYTGGEEGVYMRVLRRRRIHRLPRHAQPRRADDGRPVGTKSRHERDGINARYYDKRTTQDERP
jgi:hypothetical protein